MKVVAIDYGLKRIGLSISDEKKTMALPWKTVENDLRLFLELLETRKGEIEMFVIGLPLLMNGTKGDMAKKVELFAKALEKATSLPVVFLDERLSSKHADTALQETKQSRKTRQKHIDTTAAMFLLQSYLTVLQRGSPFFIKENI